MARSIAPTKLMATKYATVPGGALLAWAPSNAVDGMKIKITGRTFLMLANNSLGPVTVTVQSVPDRYGRTKNISKSLASGERWISPVFDTHGWVQSDGYLWIDTPDAQLYIISIEIPPN